MPSPSPWSDVIATVGRNDPCPCGSGRKYKRCCELSDAARSNQRTRLFAILGVIVVAGAIWAGMTLTGDDSNATRVGSPGQTAIPAGVPGTPPPPGPAPPGKVWSEEHGHWHDAPVGQPGAPTAQPTDPAPPGKVWSEEHGHWHDAPVTASPNDTTGSLAVPDGAISGGTTTGP